MHDRAFHEQLADSIRARRTDLGLTQVDLAELAGCSTRLVHTAESGKETLRLDKLRQLLGVLGLELKLVPRGENSATRSEGDRP